MLQYDLNPDIDPYEMKDILSELGFYEDQWGKMKKPIVIRGDEFDAIKTIEDENIAIIVRRNDSDDFVRVYKYKGEPHNHSVVELIDGTTYVQKLIEEGVVIDG